MPSDTAFTEPPSTVTVSDAAADAVAPSDTAFAEPPLNEMMGAFTVAPLTVQRSAQRAASCSIVPLRCTASTPPLSALGA